MLFKCAIENLNTKNNLEEITNLRCSLSLDEKVKIVTETIISATKKSVCMIKKIEKKS